MKVQHLIGTFTPSAIEVGGRLAKPFISFNSPWENGRHYFQRKINMIANVEDHKLLVLRGVTCFKHAEMFSSHYSVH